MATYAIHYTAGPVQGGFETYEDAIDALVVDYPDLAMGHDGDLTDGGDRTFCWRNDEEAENDDGARAVASIRGEGRS